MQLQSQKDQSSTGVAEEAVNALEDPQNKTD